MQFYKRVILLLMFLLLALTLTSRPTNAQATGTTLTVGWGAAILDTINPTKITGNSGLSVVAIRAIYDTLLTSDMKGKPIPDLAESWSFKDPTNMEFKLVQNATWHDGQPFTADDVVFTLNLFLTHKTEVPTMATYVDMITSVSAPDKYTVEIQTKSPDASFPDAKVFMLFILPRHIWENVNITTFADDNPVGTGPFKFVKWGGPNTYVQLEANRDYFRGAPKIGQLVLRYFTSYSSIALALQSGEIDYGGPLFPIATIPTLSSTPGVQVMTRLDVRYFYLSINSYSGPGAAGNPTLRDKTVRIALLHAINNSELALTTWSGYAIPMNTILPISLGDWVNPNIRGYDFNLAEAAKMLDDAGYKVGPDGIRVSPTGVKMSYSMDVASTYPQEYRTAQSIANWWKQIGVQATPRLVDTGTLADEAAYWKQDFIVWSWSGWTGTEPMEFLRVFTSAFNAPPPNPMWGDCGLNNATYDSLFLQQAQELDPAKRREIVWQMQEIIHQEAVYLGIYTPFAVEAFRSDRFTGIPPGIVPALSQFAGNNLFLSITPISVSPAVTATLATTTVVVQTGPSTEILGAIAVVIVAAVVTAFVLARRRRKPQ